MIPRKRTRALTAVASFAALFFTLPARADCPANVDSDNDGISDDCDCRPYFHDPHCEGSILFYAGGETDPHLRRDCAAEHFVCKKNPSCLCGDHECTIVCDCGDQCLPCDSAEDCQKPQVCNADKRCVNLEEALSESGSGGCSTSTSSTGSLAFAALLALAAVARSRSRARSRLPAQNR